MSARLHRDYAAYSSRQQPFKATSVQLASLKLEAITVAQNRREYVDALLIDSSEIVPVPFIRIAQNGEIVLHDFHVPLGDALCSWLKQTVTQWRAQKAADADLEADLFFKDEEFSETFAASAQVVRRAFPGMSTYPMLFHEAERYANVSPYVCKRTVVDFNPGYGYGISTLRGVASSVAASTNSLQQIAKRLRPQVSELPPGSRCDVAVYLDAPESQLEDTVALLRDAVGPNGLAIVSLSGSNAKQCLQELGADVMPMSRAGADAFGAFDEWLGVFSRASKSTYVVPEATSSTIVSERQLRILFGLRPTAELMFGGDVVQVRETAEALRERGHFVEIQTAPQLNASGFDVVHLTNITVPNETLSQARSVADFSGPVVLMPIFTDHGDEAGWGMHVSRALFLSSEDNDDLAVKLQALENRALSMAEFMPPPQRSGMIPDYEALQRAVLPYVDFAVANAHSEMHRFYRYLGCDVPYAVAPSCANPLIYGEHQKQRFIERFGLSDFVLLPGRYEHRKNQLMFFQAASALRLPLVCIGRNYDGLFGSAMRMHRPGDAVYIGHLPEEDLAGAFAAARVVAVPSWDEVVSLTSLNAAISMASMVLTRNSYEHEYFADDAEYCDPASVSSIREALRRAWETHEARAERRTRLAERVIKEYTWKNAAAATEAAYYRVLAFNPRGNERRARLGTLAV